jgi:hypothetical protein
VVNENSDDVSLITTSKTNSTNTTNWKNIAIRIH